MSDSLWVLGLFFGLFGSIGVNTGNNLQALGLHKLEEGEPNSKSKIWIIGTALFIFASLANFAAFAFAPAALLASLEATQFASNIIFGRFILGSYVSRRMYAGTICICTCTVGVVLSFAFAETEEVEYGIDEIIDCFTSTKYVIFLAMMVVLAVALNRATIILRKQNQAAAKAAVTATEVTKPERNPRDWRLTVEPITYACFSAIFGTQAVIFSKCLALLLKEGGDAFKHWLIYCTLVGWLIFVYVWLTRMNDALGKYNALFIIPLLQANYILLAIINGGIFFDEFRGFKGGHWMIFSIGLIGIFVGLYLLRPSVESDDAIDSAIAQHEEKAGFIAESKRGSEKSSLSSRPSTVRSKSSRRVSVGGIIVPPMDAPKTMKKSRLSVYLPPSEAAAVAKAAQTEQGAIGERRKSLSGRRLSISMELNKHLPEAEKRKGPLKGFGDLQMKRVSLATRFTSASLMDAKINDDLHVSLREDKEDEDNSNL
mmetsp:Transcript_10284/g.21143  ORF Transcript_10284/g.21143 Transcript_10284/m.21143 type:complete len:485 (+) Transcript_10284:161-1615(+)|eukprot:CAMPEP_0118656634 /NCGR_PEP_ID=MMETSP0785-20121206/13589_1 /TAXON_ID=91992 /ORGANISM="Bolidomonas pacifica, Strain CCMP 1866" /LENGTH=484 /DNA_ID=CAMNT_0006549497 /DNA_START=98 /DNA_END=1552 /DNA_ORIENTATION=+